ALRDLDGALRDFQCNARAADARELPRQFRQLGDFCRRARPIQSFFELGVRRQGDRGSGSSQNSEIAVFAEVYVTADSPGPGGAVDGPMRVIAQELGKRLGQQVVVENKPGAGATIGSDIVAKSPPDGYTLLLASQTNAISATLYPKLPFDAIEDFAAISLIG